MPLCRPPAWSTTTWLAASATARPAETALRLELETMQTFTIAVIAGDGVGQEVIPQAKRVLEEVARRQKFTFAFQDFDWGSAHYFRGRRMMLAGALERPQPCDANVLGGGGQPVMPVRTP